MSLNCFRVLGIALSLMAGSMAWAADFRVKAGETVTITESQSRLQVDSLILEDGAIVRFADGVSRWQVSAGRAEIGDKVQIIGTGTPGSKGPAGEAASGQAPECDDGKPGRAGGTGTKGTAGVVIAMNLKIARWGSLTIDTRGGDGGQGGVGGAGQQAGEVDKCSQTSGGTGGEGGDGGDGGNGGNVRIRYSYLPESGLNEPLEKRLTVKSRGGEGGTAGPGGKGGEGTDGHYVNMRTLSGNKKWVAGGREGDTGAEGKPGRTGVEGQLLIEEDLAGLLSQKMQQQSAQVDQIRRQLQQEVARETARIAADGAQKQEQLQAQNAALLRQLKQSQNTAENSQTEAGDLTSELSALKSSQAKQAARIDALEKQIAELKSLLQQALPE